MEDDFFIAEEVAVDFTAAGATVLGPVGTLAAALDLIARTEMIDAAMLDINLQGETVYAVADALRARGVPVVFVTGYSRGTVPEPYADIPLCEKPIEPEQVGRAKVGRWNCKRLGEWTIDRLSVFSPTPSGPMTCTMF